MVPRWLVVLALVAVSLPLWAAEAPVGPPGSVLKQAASRITHVTVYQSNALVTREVDVPEGEGAFELVVTPLPPQTVNSSLYSEGTDNIRVLTTRFRTRPVREDTREEVRKLEAQLRSLATEAQKLQADSKALEANLQMLSKLESFTAATTQQSTEKATLNGETVISLSKYIMESRAEKTRELTAIQQQVQANQEQAEFARRQLRDLTAGSNKVERDAVLVVDKRHAAPGKVRLNYLVDSASWRPQYKLRASAREKEAVHLEYLAALTQQTGEDWSNVHLVLSTAQPMLNAGPPDLLRLEVAVVPRGTTPAAPRSPAGVPQQLAANAAPTQPPAAIEAQVRGLRGQAQQEYNRKNPEIGSGLLNSAAALEQTLDLLNPLDEAAQRPGKGSGSSAREGQSVTYHLASRLTVPSRGDEQVLEVAKIDLTPGYYYKAVPVLTTHVYRLADLTNRSEYVLLPGEATMYLGTDFVGRMNLPLVAIGEQFTVGFGVDPQLQVQRQLVDKTRSMQGGNQVLRYEYRILVSSYKNEPVKLQVWDRLPHAENETVGVSLVKTAPEISKDSLYQREARPQNLLRWDLDVTPATNGEKALAIQYEFKLELDRQMAISNFSAK